MSASPLSWFSGFGIELEWMVVDSVTLEVRPIVDELLSELASEAAMEVELGPIAWSNELALHVIELKTNGPASSLEIAAEQLFLGVRTLQPLLDRQGVRLLPGGMHPFMQPDREFRLWPTDEERIYATFDRIFDCRGHGWSNLQSMHVNLPFANDDEFARLHDGVRLLLPILPALAASSPLKEGRRSAHLDERLAVYRNNAASVFEVAGHVVPERAASRAAYEANILQPIYDALHPLDPDGILRHEWVNSRGAIARFDRMAIEIRVLDTQECVKANLGLAHAVVEVLRCLVLGEARYPEYPGSEAQLEGHFNAVVERAEEAVISDPEFLAALGISGQRRRVSEIWSELLSRVPASRRSPTLWPYVERILSEGCLARRIISACGPSPKRATLVEVYSRLADCLLEDESFVP